MGGEGGAERGGGCSFVSPVVRRDGRREGAGGGREGGGRAGGEGKGGGGGGVVRGAVPSVCSVRVSAHDDDTKTLARRIVKQTVQHKASGDKRWGMCVKRTAHWPPQEAIILVSLVGQQV